ncbi:hypothetical protein [Aeromicrobium sp. UC242_57]|uniref:hypothetical protein n=1 Tax=Aeromicrobium sp. UC242_57 TaxID=3374624 RepID=UPI0037A4818D
MITIDALRERGEGRVLPGGTIDVLPHEAAIGDLALRAEDEDDGIAHPLWFVIASLRCMGITVEQLCALARQAEGDTLLFGSCEVVQEAPMLVGGTYTSDASIGDVGTRTIRDGSRLDSVEVVVELRDEVQKVGRVASTYLFKRGGRA